MASSHDSESEPAERFPSVRTMVSFASELGASFADSLKITAERLRWLVGARSLDLGVASAILVLGAAYTLFIALRLPADLALSENVWFQADILRVFENMTDRTSDHYRTQVHPLFSIATLPPTLILTKLGLEPLSAVQAMIALFGGLWFAALYTIMRCLGLQRVDSALFCVVGGATSAAVFWIGVPETYLFGSVSILAPVLVMAIAEQRRVSGFWQGAASLFSLSMTITNWMAGLLMAIGLNKPWRALSVTRDAFLVSILIFAVQHRLIPSSNFFLGWRGERQYLLMQDAGGPIERGMAFLMHAGVMPEVYVAGQSETFGWPMLSVQFAGLGAHSWLGLLALLVWLALIGFGVYAMVTLAKNARFRTFLSLLIAGQFCLHMVYGDETYLYALHWIPLLTLVAAMGAFTPFRPIVLGLAALFILLGGWNNLSQLDAALAKLNAPVEDGAFVDERRRLIAAMAAAPEGDWPRGRGHVLLGAPGAALEAKGYHEPGGAFSPGFASFGLTPAAFAPTGALLTTGAAAALDAVTQGFAKAGAAIETQTPYYQALWSLDGPAAWRLDLEPRGGARVALRLTSAGPAGGALTAITRSPDGRALLVAGAGGAWRVEADPAVLAAAACAAESAPPTLGATTVDLSACVAPDGFGALTLAWEEAGWIRVSRIAEPSAEPRADTEAAPFTPDFSVETPDARFAASLLAQIHHLRIGLVGDETRPGDPANYPLDWQRDGAYAIVALARAGAQADAERLLAAFAPRDFFGGFAAEGDAPGLALWALEEVIARADDPAALARRYWPDVTRKAALIATMMDSTSIVRMPFSGPITPEMRERSYGYLSKISEPSRDDLIRGKMDNHYPTFFVTAVSHLGLERAALIARRIGQGDAATAFEARAATLAAAWTSALSSHPDRRNARTAIAGLWPSRIAAGAPDAYRALLEENWTRRRTDGGGFTRRPLWTYFEVAEAHQWLMLGDADRTWKTVLWFWENQSSPGLFTWWEGDHEENGFGLWAGARGWADPIGVTPHYWTAAEMLALQLDMLALEKPSANGSACADAELVVGAGAPAEWLDAPIAVAGLSMRCGVLDWRWDGETLTAVWSGAETPRFTPGPSFKARGVETVGLDLRD